ncbi:DUF2278 family protein [Metabacillus sp. RGM 3146]|uniref:DUF2278 family protein n=1 Tax=Metabacillus sp. RGM 3146 TaxID=3401092 RepID=UPI003B9BEF64
MPVKNYGVLKGRAIDSRMERNSNTPHYQIHMIGEEGVHYRIAVNVMSSSEESEVLYLADDQYDASSIQILPELKNGYTKIDENNRNIALDYIRGNLFDPSKMKPLPNDVTGPDNDLNDFLDHYIQKAISEKAGVYVYGSKFGPESQPDKVFHFTPGNGIHNVHMNQGNEDKPGNQRDWAGDNGTYHDGGLLIQFQDHWAAIFLAFLSESWCTDDRGYPTEKCDHTQMKPSSSQKSPAGN